MRVELSALLLNLTRVVAVHKDARSAGIAMLVIDYDFGQRWAYAVPNIDEAIRVIEQGVKDLERRRKASADGK